MNILQHLCSYINEFNSREEESFGVDSIRVEFSKEHKLKELNSVGSWSKIKKNSPLLSKLKKRLTDNEITTVWRLENYSIYYYNMQDFPKYRSATLVIFGLKQYHKVATPENIITKILTILKDVSNIDICLDLPYKPNLEALAKHFYLKEYITQDGIVTDTSYINDTGILMLDKITIYNKGFKNKLQQTVWRLEAQISIPNFKALALPLSEFRQIINIARSNI